MLKKTFQNKMDSIRKKSVSIETKSKLTPSGEIINPTREDISKYKAKYFTVRKTDPAMQTMKLKPIANRTGAPKNVIKGVMPKLQPKTFGQTKVPLNIKWKK